MILKSIIGTLLFLTASGVALGQSTIRYNGILANSLLTESIELYPDSTFKWKNEYDLSWTEFGRYYIQGTQLKLLHYIQLKQPVTMSVKDSISKINKPFRMTLYELNENKMYSLDNRGKRVTTVKDKSIKTKWSWLLGYSHDFYYKREESAN